MNGSLLWVTNIPTPYRAALWSALRSVHELTVLALADTEPNRDWDHGTLITSGQVDVVPCPRLVLHRELTVYLPTKRLLSTVGRFRGTVLVDGWESPAFQACIAAAHRSGNPVIIGYRGTRSSHRLNGRLTSLYRASVLRRADVVLTGGPPSTEAVLDAGVPRARIVEGLNVVDVDRFHSRAQQLRDPQRPAGHAFLCVGQLAARKNLTATLDAFARVREAADTLTIVGTGPERAALAAQADRLGISHQVRWRGHLDGDELVSAYTASDTLVLASLAEVYGLVVAEALATGAHAVVSRRAGCAASLGGQRGVFLADPNPDALGQAMVESRQGHHGPITEPEILQQDPTAAAVRVLEAARLAADVASRRC